MSNDSRSNLFWSSFESSVGPVVYIRSSKGLVSLGFSAQLGEAATLENLVDPLLSPCKDEHLRLTRESPKANLPQKLEAWLLGDSPVVDFDFMMGTPLQKLVWQALLTIPRGATATYSDIARMVDHPTAIRVVASAIGANPISVFIPCHRVLRKDGSLGGYRWGNSIKELLLKMESPYCKGAGDLTSESSMPGH